MMLWPLGWSTHLSVLHRLAEHLRLPFSPMRAGDMATSWLLFRRTPPDDDDESSIDAEWQTTVVDSSLPSLDAASLACLACVLTRR